MSGEGLRKGLLPMAGEVELIQIPEEFRGIIDLADRRIAGLMMAWTRGGDLDLGFLLRSVYEKGS